MKQNLFNKLWLRVGMIVAIMTTALSGTAWAETTITIDFENNALPTGWTNNNDMAVVSNPVSSSTNGSYCLSTNGKASNSLTSGYIENIVSISVDATRTSNNTTNEVYIDFCPNTSFGSSDTQTQSVTVNKNSWSTSTLTLSTKASGYVRVRRSGGNSTATKFIDNIVITCEDAGGSTLTANDLTLNATEKEFDLADGANQTFQLTNSGSADGALSYESNNTAVATVSNTGLITAVGEGTATITVTQAASETYAGGTATCTVTVTDSRYTISNLTFTDKCNGSGTADDNVAWTVASDGTESAFDNTKGIHYGTGSAAVQYITLTTSGINGTIKKIVVNASTANDVSATASVTVGGAAFGGEAQSLTSSAADYTFTGSASGEIVVTVTKPSSATKALYVKSIKVYYIPSTDPYITAEDVTIAYDETSGEIGYSLTNATGNVTATVTDGDWLTLGTITSSEVPFTCTTNPNSTARTATVTLSFSGAEDKVVTVTQTRDPNALMTIAEARAQGTGNVHTKGIVTSCVGTTAYIQDANAAICVYGESLTVGEEIEVSGTLTDFHGLLEITEPTVTVLSQENTVTPEVLTIAQVKASTKQGWLVKIENATVTEVGSNNNYTIAQGEETITLHGALGEVVVNDVITFTGNIGYYNSVQLVNPTDVTVTGTVTPTTYTLSWTAGEHTELFVFDAADETTPLTSGDEIAAGTTILVSVDVESGYELESLEVDGVDVTSQIDETGAYTFTMPTHAVTITATAEEYVAPTGGTIYFGNNGTKINSTSVTGSDSNENTWTITTAFDGETSFTQQNDFSQVGAAKKPATSITFTTTLPAEATITSFEAKFGGFSGTEGDVTLKVGDTTVGTGSLNAANDVTVTNTSTATGTVLTVTVTNIAKGVKCYYISYELATSTSQTVTVSAAGYATIVAEADLEIPEDVEVFAVTVNGAATSAHLEAITGGIPEGEAVLVKASADSYEFPYAAEAVDAISSNDLVAATTDVTADGTQYCLAKKNDTVGFYKVQAGIVIPAGKAYLVVSNGVKAFYGFDDDDATAISSVESFTEDGAIYNLAGQRLQKMQKGINIVNGKKVLK